MACRAWHWQLRGIATLMPVPLITRNDWLWARITSILRPDTAEIAATGAAGAGVAGAGAAGAGGAGLLGGLGAKVAAVCAAGACASAGGIAVISAVDPPGHRPSTAAQGTDKPRRAAQTPPARPAVTPAATVAPRPVATPRRTSRDSSAPSRSSTATTRGGGASSRRASYAAAANEFAPQPVTGDGQATSQPVPPPAAATPRPPSTAERPTFSSEFSP